MRLKKILTIVLLAALCCFSVFTVTACNSSNKKEAEMKTGLYFRTPKVAEQIYVIKQENLNKAEEYMIVSLQGILAQTEARIIIDYARDSSLWIKDLETSYGKTLIETSDPWELVTTFKSDINGSKYVLFDSVQTSQNMFNQSVNYAATVSGAERYLMIESSIKETAEVNGLTQGKDVRNSTTRAIFNEYSGKLNKTYLVHQKPEMTELRDYAIAGKAFCFYSDFDADKNIKQTILQWADINAPIFGWTENELNYVSANSLLSKLTMPADWSTGLSLFSGLSNSDELKQTKYVQETIVADKNKHYLSIVMSDGDNLQWTQNNFVTNQRYFGSPNRGEFKMTWGISPSFYDVAPNMIKKSYELSTAKDQFITGPGGLGYANISEYNRSSLDSYAALTAGYMAKTDLQYVNFIDNFIDRDALDSFSKFPQIKGGVWSVGEKYIAGNGGVYWSGDKPFIAARETLWRIPGDDYSNKYYGFTERVAQRINGYKKDPTTIEGYTVLVAHAWSIGAMDYISRFVSQLDSDVELVTVGEMVDLVAKNVKKTDVSELNDIKPDYFDDNLASISSEQLRWLDIKDTSAANLKSFTFESANDLGGWKLGHGGLQYDRAQWDSWGRKNPGSIMLEGSDLEDVLDPIPNAWMYNAFNLAAGTDNYLEIGLKGGGDADTNLRIRALYEDGNSYKSEYLTDSFGDAVNDYGYYLLNDDSPNYFSFDISPFAGKKVIFSIEQDDNGDGTGEIVFVDEIYIKQTKTSGDNLTENTAWNSVDDIYADWDTFGNVEKHSEGVCLEGGKIYSDEFISYIYISTEITQVNKYMTFSMRKFDRVGQTQDLDPHIFVIVNDEIIKAYQHSENYVSATADEYQNFYYSLNKFVGQKVKIKIASKGGQHAAINKIRLMSDVNIFEYLKASKILAKDVSTLSAWTAAQIEADWGVAGTGTVSGNDYVIWTQGQSNDCKSLIYNKFNISNGKNKIKFDCINYVSDAEISVKIIDENMNVEIIKEKSGTEWIALSDTAKSLEFDISKYDGRTVTVVIGTRVGPQTAISNLVIS